MHSKRKFKAFLGFNWHWYLIILLSTLFMFYFLFETLRTPGYDEKVVVFIGSKYVEVERLENDLYKAPSYPSTNSLHSSQVFTIPIFLPALIA